VRWSLAGVPVAIALGVVAGLAGTLAHGVGLLVGPLTLPIGLVVALALVGCVQAFLVAAFPTRAVAVAGVLAWGLAAYLAVTPGPGGDLLLAGSFGGGTAVWLLGSPVVLGLATVLTRRVVTAPGPVPAG